MARWSGVWHALAVLGLVACIASCDTKHHGISAQPDWFEVKVNVPAGLFGGEAATWSASWTGGVGPFTIFWDFGGGAENIGPVPATSPDSRVVVMQNLSGTDPAAHTYRVVVTDSQGATATAESMYTIGPDIHIPRPEIVNVSFSDPVLTVSVVESSGNDVTVYPSEIEGLSFTPASVDISGGNGDAMFVWTADNVFSGCSGATTITADNGVGGTDTANQAIVIHGTSFVEPDTLYVLPMENKIGTGEPVTFVCATGTLPNPFNSLNGVAVIIEDDADYVPNSFNVGEPGGAADAVDGVWTAVSPTGFLLADNLIQAEGPAPSNSIPAGRERWQFNLTGIGGSDANGVQGQLFNFQFTFSEPGLKRIGLQHFDGVKRTYYSDGARNEYLWGALMADEHGELNTLVDNTVLVE